MTRIVTVRMEIPRVRVWRIRATLPDSFRQDQRWTGSPLRDALPGSVMDRIALLALFAVWYPLAPPFTATSSVPWRPASLSM
jgi:hypothetical protein